MVFRLVKWENGRQNATSSLKKLKIWSILSTDCYLLKLEKGCEIGEHLDVIPSGKKHYRFNLTLYGLWTLQKGDDVLEQSSGKFHLFRPDIIKHGATVKTDTLILSIGLAI
jgi:hypothetical protein